MGVFLIDRQTHIGGTRLDERHQGFFHVNIAVHDEPAALGLAKSPLSEMKLAVVEDAVVSGSHGQGVAVLDKLRHALSLVQSTHSGKDYDSQWGKRMAGSGPYAWMIGRRFEIAATRLGYKETGTRLRSDLFHAPEDLAKGPKQLSMF